MPNQRYRVVTRSDLDDGFVCGVLLRQLDLIDDVKFVHDRDIVTNLPLVAGCHPAFDHHASEISRLGADVPANHVIDPSAPSAARIVHDHFGGAAAFPRISAELTDAVD